MTLPPRPRLSALSALAALFVPVLGAACEVSATGVAFGRYDPLAGSGMDSAGGVRIHCDAPTPYTIELSSGAGSYSERRMESEQATLAYNLYVDAGRTVIWGDGSGGTGTVSGTAGGAPADHPIYGHLPRQPLAVPGSYSDTIVVTVTY